MNRIVFGLVAAAALFMLADSLTCNKCALSLVGYCIFSSSETCATNTSVCYTGTATFSSISSFSGFSTQSCSEPMGCNSTMNGTLLGATYTVTTVCCSSDKCNPIQANGAPSTRMTLTAALGAAVLASAWSSML